MYVKEEILKALFKIFKIHKLQWGWKYLRPHSLKVTGVPRPQPSLPNPGSASEGSIFQGNVTRCESPSLEQNPACCAGFYFLPTLLPEKVNRFFTRAALSVAMGATADQTCRFRLYLFSASLSEIMSLRLNSVWLVLHHPPQFLRGKLLLNRNCIYGDLLNCWLNCTFL